MRAHGRQVVALVIDVFRSQALSIDVWMAVDSIHAMAFKIDQGNAGAGGGDSAFHEVRSAEPQTVFQKGMHQFALPGVEPRGGIDIIGGTAPKGFAV